MSTTKNIYSLVNELNEQLKNFEKQKIEKQIPMYFNPNKKVLFFSLLSFVLIGIMLSTGNDLLKNTLTYATQIFSIFCWVIYCSYYSGINIFTKYYKDQVFEEAYSIFVGLFFLVILFSLFFGIQSGMLDTLQLKNKLNGMVYFSCGIVFINSIFLLIKAYNYEKTDKDKFLFIKTLEMGINEKKREIIENDTDLNELFQIHKSESASKNPIYETVDLLSNILNDKLFDIGIYNIEDFEKSKLYTNDTSLIPN